MSGIGRYHDLTRRALVFAVVGLIGCVVMIGAIDPGRWAGADTAALALLDRVQASGRRFDGAHVPGLVAVGAAAGVLAGMLGMGGVLQTAGLMAVFPVDMMLARAVSLTTMFAAMASAAWAHVRHGRILWQVVRPMVLPSVTGTLGGVFLGLAIPATTLAHTFAFLTVFLGFNMLAQTAADPDERALERTFPAELGWRLRLTCGSVGAFHGLICGLLGIAGGVIAMPLQQLLLRVPARNAVANSAFISAVSTSAGSIVAVLSGLLRRDFQLADVALGTVALGGASIIGAQLGARWIGKVPVYVLKLLFALVIFAAGLAILFK